MPAVCFYGWMVDCTMDKKEQRALVINAYKLINPPDKFPDLYTLDEVNDYDDAREMVFEWYGNSPINALLKKHGLQMYGLASDFGPVIAFWFHVEDYNRKLHKFEGLPIPEISTENVRKATAFIQSLGISDEPKIYTLGCE